MVHLVDCRCCKCKESCRPIKGRNSSALIDAFTNYQSGSTSETWVESVESLCLNKIQGQPTLLLSFSCCHNIVFDVQSSQPERLQRSSLFLSVPPPSRGAEARPQAVQCLINSRRLDRGRRKNLQRIWRPLCATSNPALDPIVASLLIVDLTFCWDILLKDGAPGQKGFPSRETLSRRREMLPPPPPLSDLLLLKKKRERKKKHKKSQALEGSTQFFFVGFFCSCIFRLTKKKRRSGRFYCCFWMTNIPSFNTQTSICLCLTANAFQTRQLYIWIHLKCKVRDEGDQWRLQRSNKQYFTGQLDYQ